MKLNQSGLNTVDTLWTLTSLLEYTRILYKTFIDAIVKLSTHTLNQ